MIEEFPGRKAYAFWLLFSIELSQTLLKKNDDYQFFGFKTDDCIEKKRSQGPLFHKKERFL